MVTPPQTTAALEALAEVATAPRHKPTLPAPRRPPPHAPGAKAAREERAPKRRCHGAADPSRREFGALSDRERFPLGGGGFPAMELRPDDAYRGAAGDKLRQGRECRDWLERTRAQRYLARLLLTNGEARPAAERLPGEEPVWPLLTADSLRVRTLEARGRSSWSECSGYKKQAEIRKQPDPAVDAVDASVCVCVCVSVSVSVSLSLCLCVCVCVCCTGEYTGKPARV